MELLQNLHRAGSTILMVTHDTRFARHADRGEDQQSLLAGTPPPRPEHRDGHITAHRERSQVWRRRCVTANTCRTTLPSTS